MANEVVKRGPLKPNATRVLTQAQVCRAVRMRQKGSSLRDIALALGCSHVTIHMMMMGKRYKAEVQACLKADKAGQS